MVKTCWYHKFGGGEPCNEVGLWYWPNSQFAVVRAMVWCDKHKHDNDIPIGQHDRNDAPLASD